MQPGQGHVTADAGALAGPGIAPALDHDRLALGHVAADRGSARLSRKGSSVARAEKGVLPQTAVDEGGIEVVIDRPDATEKHLIANGARLRVCEAYLHQAAVLEEARQDAEQRRLDDQLATHDADRQPSPRSRSSVAASGRPTTFE